MKTKPIVILAFALILSLKAEQPVASAGNSAIRSVGRALSTQLPVSIYRALAVPEKYEGKTVRIVGLYSRDSSECYLFPSLELKQTHDTQSAVYLDGKLKTGEKIPNEFIGKFVTVDGTLGFDPSTDQVSLNNITYVGLRLIFP